MNEHTFVCLFEQASQLLKEWTNEWMNEYILWIFKSAFNSELGMRKHHIMPNTHPEPTAPPTNHQPPPTPDPDQSGLSQCASVPSSLHHSLFRELPTRFGSSYSKKKKKKERLGEKWKKKNATLPFPRANLFTETILCRWSAACLKSGLKRRRSSDVCAYINAPLFVIIYRLLCVIGSQG